MGFDPVDPHYSRPRKNAFTLIELLVVVAIIALLIAILLPSLGRARDNAKATACLANLKSIGQCSVIYNADNENFMVPAYYIGSGPTDESWATIFVSLNYIPRQFPNDAAHMSGQTYIGGAFPSRTALFCPECLTDKTSGQSPVSPTDPDGNRPTFYFSDKLGAPSAQYYGTNCQTFDPGHITPGRRVPADNTINGKKEVWLPKSTQMGATSRIVYFFDGVYCNLGGVTSGQGGFNRIAARHRQQSTTNIMFCDGHAESVARSKLPSFANTGDMTSSLDPNVTLPLIQDLNKVCPEYDFRLDQHP